MASGTHRLNDDTMARPTCGVLSIQSEVSISVPCCFDDTAQFLAAMDTTRRPREETPLAVASGPALKHVYSHILCR